LDALVDRCIGYWQRRSARLHQLRNTAEEVIRLAPQLRTCSEAVLRERLAGYREQFRRPDRVSEPVLREALAAVREAAARTIGLEPFPEQILGALALYRGFLAEMATGEGKTLTAGLAAVLFGWTRRPCHVVTVNDYLAERDAAWMRPLFEFCGVTSGCVLSTMDAAARRRAYACDVTYTTSKEVVADFLRDRLALGAAGSHPARLWLAQLVGTQPHPALCVQRGLHTAIVDEADSVLIDEAVTPLIISASTNTPAEEEIYRRAWAVAASLEPGRHYRVDPRHRDVELLPPGRAALDEAWETVPRYWRSPWRREQLLRQALVAREFFHRNVQYVVQDRQVILVDEFTGRLMPHRRWRAGLHQLIEAREGLPLTPPDQTLARLSFQRFFRLYRHLCGMTGTAQEAAAEFWHVYRLPVLVIPRHRPCIREQWPDCVFPDTESKWHAVVEEIRRVHATGRSVLVGTRSVAASEELARRLREAGLEFNLLNATRHREEAAIVAQAGQPGRITIATNMAGRGTDIKLGPGMAALGGLHVIATEKHESPRIDRQLYGRAGRQGDPGSARAFLSLEDELFRRFLPGSLRRALTHMLRQRVPGSERAAAAACVLAQHRAAREAYRQRLRVLRHDTWLDESLSFVPPERL
jgi:preprotein translocase subunit SecA